MTPKQRKARDEKVLNPKGYKQDDLRRRKYRKERIVEEEHAMDKPKTLESQTDGDLSEVKKDPIWKTWIDKRGEDMGDKVSHPEDVDWKSKLKPASLEYVAERYNEKRPDINVQGRMTDATGKPKVEHPQTDTPGLEPVKEGQKPSKLTTPSGLAGPMGSGEAKRRRGSMGAMPINRAMAQLVKFRLRKPKRTWADTGNKPTGIPESTGNVDQYNHPYKPREAPKPTDKPEQKISTTTYKKPKQVNVAGEGKAHPLGATATKVPKEREQKETNVAMGGLDKPRRSSSSIENIDRSVDLWKRDLEETGESDDSHIQDKGKKIQAHPPLGSDKEVDVDGEEVLVPRVKPSDKPHKVVDPLKPYNEVSGGFVQNEKVPNLIDAEVPKQHDKLVKPSNTSPIKPPEKGDSSRKTLPRHGSDERKKAWEVWLKEKDAINTKQAREKLPKKVYCPSCGQVDPVASNQQKEEGQSHGEQSTAARGGSTLYTDTDNDKEVFRETSPPMSGWKTGRTGGKGFRNALYNDLGDPRDYSHEYYQGQMSDSDDKGAMKKKAWEVWLDNVTKPIPDSKGGRGSFQHCINANKDKKNPGGWCKQIERKVGGVSKGRTARDRKRRQQEVVEAETANLKDKADYFVEEIRAEIIYQNKIAPLIGALAGGVGRAVGSAGKKVAELGEEFIKPIQGEEDEV